MFTRKAKKNHWLFLNDGETRIYAQEIVTPDEATAALWQECSDAEKDL